MQISSSPLVDQVVKAVGYRIVGRLPVLKGLVQPRHRFNLEPAQLACLINAIEATEKRGGTICEIGVAMGRTSVFLLEHMRSSNDGRKVFFIDTFSGFTSEAIEHEVERRGKKRWQIDCFKYGSRDVFERNLLSLGYENFEVVAGDCAKVDYDRIGPIDVCLIDVDLYVPTSGCLESVWKHLAPGGICMVDDCMDDERWDGAYAAYSEFISAHGLPYRRVGNKGGLITKPG